MTERAKFLSDLVGQNDLVCVTIVGIPRPQVFRAKVERIYSVGRGMDASGLGAEIDFVGPGNGWGNCGTVPLAVGDRALLFIQSIGDRLYESHWFGHMVLEEIEGTLYAICKWKQMWQSEHVPISIRESSRQDPRRPYASAVRFDVMEDYLIRLIAAAGLRRS